MSFYLYMCACSHIGHKPKFQSDAASSYCYCLLQHLLGNSVVTFLTMYNFRRWKLLIKIWFSLLSVTFPFTFCHFRWGSKQQVLLIAEWWLVSFTKIYQNQSREKFVWISLPDWSWFALIRIEWIIFDLVQLLITDYQPVLKLRQFTISVLLFIPFLFLQFCAHIL